jgi:hypothetical protein
MQFIKRSCNNFDRLYSKLPIEYLIGSCLFGSYIGICTVITSDLANNTLDKIFPEYKNKNDNNKKLIYYPIFYGVHSSTIIGSVAIGFVAGPVLVPALGAYVPYKLVKNYLIE